MDKTVIMIDQWPTLVQPMQWVLPCIGTCLVKFFAIFCVCFFFSFSFFSFNVVVLVKLGYWKEVKLKSFLRKLDHQYDQAICLLLHCYEFWRSLETLVLLLLLFGFIHLLLIC